MHIRGLPAEVSVPRLADDATLEEQGAVVERKLREVRAEMRGLRLTGNEDPYKCPVTRVYRLLYEESVLVLRLQEVMRVLEERDALVSALRPVVQPRLLPVPRETLLWTRR